MLLKEFNKEELNIKVFDTRDNMADAAVKETTEAIKTLLSQKEEVNIIFAAAPSQSEMLKGMVETPDIPWERINAFHQDDYIGLDSDAPQLFANFLDRNIFKKCPFKNVYYLKGSSKQEAKEECERYTMLLKEKPIDIALVGIGENGHLAFNDPHVADFNDKETVKVVILDGKCRMQQVNDGCFKTIEDVPAEALTLTIPALMSAEYIFCTVPAPQKRNAVTRAVQGEVNEECPASILRRKKGSKLFLDKDSGADLL